MSPAKGNVSLETLCIVVKATLLAERASYEHQKSILSVLRTYMVKEHTLSILRALDMIFYI